MEIGTMSNVGIIILRIAEEYNANLYASKIKLLSTANTSDILEITIDEIRYSHVKHGKVSGEDGIVIGIFKPAEEQFHK